MRIFASALIILLTVTSGYGAEYYVSKSGSDSNPGTEAQPWKTIQKAANTMLAGDTVYTKAGTYNERVIPKNSGTAGNYITYTAYANDEVIIDGSGINLPYDWGGLVDISGKSYIKISGLQIKNAGPNDNNPGILVDNCSYIIIENNYTYNTTSSGIGVWDSNNITIDNNEVELACNDGEQECITLDATTNFEIKNNHVHDSGPGTIGGEGIDAKNGCSYGKIYNNHVHDLNRLGIYVDAWENHTYDIEIYNNIVYNINGNDCYTLASEAGGLLENIRIYNNIGYNADVCGLTVSRNGDSSTHPMKNIYVINNTFCNNGAPPWGGGIAVDNPDIQSLVIRNNILSQNHSFQMEVEPDVSMSKLTVDHNLIHGYRHYDDEIKGNDYVEGDPLFVNALIADFHLKKDSPAIDSGSSTNAPADDYEGNTRPQGCGYDIGAYEYVSSNGGQPEISLSQRTINVTVVSGSTTPEARWFTISNSGTGTLDWSVTDNADWLSVNPSSGTDSETVTVTIDPSGLSIGSYTGTVTVSSTNAANSPQTVTVNLTIQSPPQDEEEPFGSFDTPVHGSTVRSSIPVTGWALDDVAVESVKIYREPVSGEGSNMVYIGNATFVEGARPDVENAFPGYPNNSRAGWGYMLLTNFLPNGGNGTFTLYAVAKDGVDNEVILGSKTIICDNANAVKPFGAIDTPSQGGTASGSSFINWGWVLTPQPNSIPTDGSTINVYVDGVNLGQPVYNIYRQDIATLFPGYANSNGAVGYFYLDTTAYADGVHTIQWTAADNAGNTDGIGSRYFTIQNTGGSAWRMAHGPGRSIFLRPGSLLPLDSSSDEPIYLRRGYSENVRPQRIYPGKDGIVHIEIEELERVEIHFLEGTRGLAPLSNVNEFSNGVPDGFRIVGKRFGALPIGSTLDRKLGVFYWQPGPGFLGEYQFHFISKEKNGKFTMRRLKIKIVPKFPE
ncbi:MAG: right-handed parallel beta-helix repeat-containing protein [Candidatus Aminicenantes bacterium]|nr:MAG: right-handed parallel beta-helix repeat-containing protein [Candidatus Aminicenantes bacterium]